MGGYSDKVKIKLEAETKLFNRNIQELMAVTRKGVDDVLKEWGINFLQSAAKATPEAKLKQRKLIQADERTWKVPFKRIGKQGYMKSPYSGRNSIYFHDENEAQIYRRITFKGIHRFGWSANLFKFGKTPSVKNPSLLPIASKIAETIIKKSNIAGIGAFIEMKNKVKLIGGWGDYTKKEGLFNVNKRMSGYLKTLKVKMKRSWK